MTHSEAFYQKLMLSVGITEEYDKYIAQELEVENPLSDIILELSFCTNDINKTLVILNEYLFKAEIDYTKVFDLVWQYLHEVWKGGNKTNHEIAKFMYDIATHLDEDKMYEYPWSFMMWLDDYFELAEIGMRVSKEALDEAFAAFIEDKNTEKIYAL